MPPENQPRQPTWASYLIIVVICLVVLVPAVFAGFLPAERPRWIEAQAAEAQLNGNYDAALAAFDELVKLNSSRERVYRLARLELLNRAGRYEDAVLEGEALIEAYPGPWKEDDTSGLVDANESSQMTQEPTADSPPPEKEEKEEESKSPTTQSTGEPAASAESSETEKPAQLSIVDFPHYQQLSISYQALGKFDKALAVLLRTEQYGLRENDDRTINNLAYARSLAGKDLLPAYRIMDQMIDSQYNEATLFHMSAYHHWLLLRDGEREFAYQPDLREKVLRWALADFATAIQDRTKIVEEAIRLMDQVKRDQDQTKSDKPAKEAIPEAAKETSKPQADIADDATEQNAGKSTGDDVPDDLIGRNRRELALILAHRANVFEKVGDEENAEADWERVRALGFSPQALAKQELNLAESGRRVGTLAMWLDTRGYLKYRLRNYQGAKSDFEKALRLRESYISLLRLSRVSNAQKSPDVRNETQSIRDADRSLAAMLYHVWEVDRDMGDQEGAARCRERIEALGFELGPHLH